MFHCERPENSRATFIFYIQIYKAVISIILTSVLTRSCLLPKVMFSVLEK